MPVDILLTMEDPGAANYLAPLPDALAQLGIQCATLAHRRLTDTLTVRRVPHTVIGDNPDPSAILRQTEPALLVVGTAEDPNAVGLALIDAARRNAIPSIAAVDMIANATGRFRGTGSDPLAHCPDWLMVCDDATRDAFADLGVATEHITVCGHPHFDWVRSRRQHLSLMDRQAARTRMYPDAPPDSPVIVFAAEGFDRVDPKFSRHGDDYTLHGRGTTEFRTAIVLEELLDAIAGMTPRPYLVVRMHPKSPPDELSAYDNEVDFFSTSGEALPLIWAADAVVGMTSMLLVEAFLIGKPTLAIVPRRNEADLLVTTANSLTPIASTRDDVRQSLDKLFAAPADATIPGLPIGAINHAASFVANRLANARQGQPIADRRNCGG